LRQGEKTAKRASGGGGVFKIGDPTNPQAILDSTRFIAMISRSGFCAGNDF
jgi:hypothetical protein